MVTDRASERKWPKRTRLPEVARRLEAEYGRDMSEEAPPAGERLMKRCPDCAELVQPDARICRFCRFNFDTGLSAGEVTPDIATNEDGIASADTDVRRPTRPVGARSVPNPVAPPRKCPHCSKGMPRNATTCPHCGFVSDAWILHGGLWWLQVDGDWGWFTADGRKWVRYKPWKDKIKPPHELGTESPSAQRTKRAWAHLPDIKIVLGVFVLGAIGVGAIIDAASPDASSKSGGSSATPVVATGANVYLVASKSFCSPSGVDDIYTGDGHVVFFYTFKNSGGEDGTVTVTPVRHYDDGKLNMSPLDSVEVTVPAHGTYKARTPPLKYKAHEHEIVECGAIVDDRAEISIATI